MEENKQEENKKITIDDFKKVELKLGKILNAEKVPDTDKLLRLSVDLGEEHPRQIVSGIALYFPNTEDLIGKKCMFVANLAPRTIRGFESNGMILALSNDEGKFSLLSPDVDMDVGVSAK